MVEEKKYYKYLDIVRILLCISILLYHMGILKGGYLAVCSFFVLSGYLSCISSFNQNKFSLLKYYKSRFIKIYIPLCITVFISIFVISKFSNIIWLNLKPETTSVLLGYNNFWQIFVNNDYFAHQMNSPFMHLWYVSILMQLELVFPFIFMALKKIGDKISKLIPLIILFILAIGSAYCFCSSPSITISYYSTISRLFPFVLGMALGFLHHYYGKQISKKIKNGRLCFVFFLLYVVILASLFIYIDASSPYFEICMILVSIITLRLTDYATIMVQKKDGFTNKIFRFLANISYEIYLVQYPVIFLMPYINIPGLNLYKNVLILLSTFVFSYMIYASLNNFKKLNKWKLALCTILVCLSGFGGNIYIVQKDYTLEMQNLEKQLSKNEIEMHQKQEAFMASFEEENRNYQIALDEIEQDEDKLKDVVTNLPVIGIGDSVMLGAIENLYETFPNGYIDAKVSRTAWLVNGIIEDLKQKKMFGNPIIINLGANGDCSEACKIEIMESCEGKEVFWVNVTNDIDVNVNSKLEKLSAKYANLHIVDWEKISKGHPEYFIADSIHLTSTGRKAFADAIYDSIYNYYLEEYNIKKQEVVDEYNHNLKTKISFYGNDILIGAFNNIEASFENANFIIDQNFDYIKVKQQLEQFIEDDSLTYKLVFAFDNHAISKEEYEELITLCKGHQIYIVSTGEDLSSLNSENVKVIPFNKEIDAYLMADKRHLNEEGNARLSRLLKDTIK